MAEPAPPSACEVRVQAACFSGGSLLCALHSKAGSEYWVLPGGHVEPGESLWDALAREMVEETGLTLEAGRLWALSEFHAPGRHVVECTFLIEAFGGRPLLGIDPEGTGHPATLIDLKWIDRPGFADFVFRPTLLGRHLRAHWDDPMVPASYLGVESTTEAR